MNVQIIHNPEPVEYTVQFMCVCRTDVTYRTITPGYNIITCKQCGQSRAAFIPDSSMTIGVTHE